MAENTTYQSTVTMLVRNDKGNKLIAFFPFALSLRIECKIQTRERNLQQCNICKYRSCIDLCMA
jgi:hypothetical protein